MKISKTFKGLFLTLLIVLPVIFSGCDNNDVKEVDDSASSVTESQVESLEDDSSETDTSEEDSSIDDSSEIELDEEDTTGPAMWEVTSKDGDTTLYLFGSIHAANDDAYPFRDDVLNAFEESDYLAVECNIVAYEKDIKAQLASVGEMMYDDGTTIKDHLSEETYEKMKEVLTEYNSYSSLYECYKPCFWSSLLDNVMIQESNIAIAKGIDRYFIAEADKSHKEILEVESVEFQMDMLFGFSDELQDMLIMSSVQDMDGNIKMLNNLYELWLIGDAENIDKINSLGGIFLTKEQKALYNDYNQAMLIDRNVGMAETAEEYMEDNKEVFFVVGVAHMVGDDGIVQLLINDGYTVTRV